MSEPPTAPAAPAAPPSSFLADSLRLLSLNGQMPQLPRTSPVPPAAPGAGSFLYPPPGSSPMPGSPGHLEPGMEGASPGTFVPGHRRVASGGKRPKKIFFNVHLPEEAAAPEAAAFPEALTHMGKVVVMPGPATLDVEGSQITATHADFEKLAELGRGVHGSVFKVRHTPTGLVMAMKDIELTTQVDSALGQRIVRELDVLRGGRQCPFIVTYYGTLYQPSLLSIVMEHMALGALDALLRLPAVGRFPELLCGKIAIAAILGLQFLQARLRVIHRDVKPSNILVNDKGQVKVCDFSVSGELVKSCAQSYVGTMYYMAPERIQPTTSREYNIQADVWSLGVTLVELATGEYPYPQEKHVYSMLRHIVQGDSPVKRLAEGSHSPSFVGFLQRCLEKDPHVRADYAELLAHPFAVQCAEDHDFDVAKWLTDRGAGQASC